MNETFEAFLDAGARQKIKEVRAEMQDRRHEEAKYESRQHEGTQAVS